MWIVSLAGIYSFYLVTELHQGSMRNPVYNRLIDVKTDFFSEEFKCMPP
jgi:hypothetical protein